MGRHNFDALTPIEKPYTEEKVQGCFGVHALSPTDRDVRKVFVLGKANKAPAEIPTE